MARFSIRSKNGIVVLLGLFLFLLFPFQVVADEIEIQSGTQTEAEKEKVYMKIGTVRVSEETPYLTTADLPASVDVLGADQIETENVDFALELLKKVPGTYYGDWNQGIISSTFSMRGYDVNTAAPVALSIDGIPSYYSSLNGIDIQPIFSLEIERMELLKGNIDPRYGINNVAGTLNVHTKQGGNFTTVRMVTGSFNTYDGGIITGHEDGNFSQTYFANFRSSEGYRDHSDLEKGAFSGKWFLTTSDGKGSIGAIARYFKMTADAPGYLTEEIAEEDPTLAATFARTDGGEQENGHVSLHFDYEFTEALSWSVKTYLQKLERSRWARWSTSGSQSETLIDDSQYGAISTLTYVRDDLGIKLLKLNWGIDYQFDESTEQRWTTEDRVRQGTETRYYDNEMYYWGSYVQADGEINDWLRLFGALRVDSFYGEMENKLTNTESDMLDLEFIWQPKFGTVITPYHGYSFYANWGRTFQLPGIPDRYGQDTSGNIKNTDLTESTNDGWEAGIKASPFDWLSVRADYWEMVATDEVRKKADGSGDKINVGETDRKGWDVAFSVRPHPYVSAWGSYSFVEAIYTDPGPEMQDRKGKDIELIPDYTAKLGIDFDHPVGFSCGLWMEAQGDYYVLTDPENKNKQEGDYEIFNFKTSYKFQNNTTIGVDVRNIFDEDYYAFVWSLSNGFQPGDGRSVYGWVSFDF
jgi:iron complex outermembrane receptor protein